MPIGKKPAMARARGEHGIERLIQLTYGYFYGDPDLHTHIRWRAIRHHIRTANTTVDIACGDGSITLEIAEAFPEMSIHGVDLNPLGITLAKERASATSIMNATFEVGNVTDFRFGTIDQALLLDVLEHVDDDAGLLASVSRAIRPGGRVVVSVPTPEYPRFFGREFHLAVGHVRDGYSRFQITRLLNEAGFRILSAEHYTKLPASLACYPFYRYLWKKGRIGMALSPFLNVFSLLEKVWPSSTFASSVLVVGIKT